MQIVTTTIDNSADVFLDTNSRSRYVNYPMAIECGLALPIFTTDCKTCVSDPFFSHSFESNSIISLQFVLGNYALLDVTTAKVQILDKDENIIKEADYIGLTNDIDVVDSEFTEAEGLRVSFVFKPSNIESYNCFWIRAIFTVDGVDYSFTSQKYNRARCTDLVKIESTYREFGKDCLGAYYDGSYQNVYYINGDLEKQEFTFNDVSYNSKGQKTYAENYEVYILKAVVNEATADLIANILKGRDIMANGVSYFNNRLIEKNNEANGMWVIEVELLKRCVSDIGNC